MKKFLLASVLCVVMHAAFAQQPSNVAYEDARVRFTVIADGVIRMEYAPDGKFVGSMRPSIAGCVRADGSSYRRRV